MAKGKSERMKFGKQGTDVIIRYIEQSLRPIENGEVLVNGDIATKGRIRRWFMDILEGQIPVILYDKMNRTDYWFVKMHYVWGQSWAQIHRNTMIPESTLRYRRERFFKAVVEVMPIPQGVEILKIHRRHEADSHRQARWENESE